MPPGLPTARAEGLGLRRIAAELHVGVGTALRVLGEEHRTGMAGYVCCLFWGSACARPLAQRRGPRALG
jgi:hypothetical protein